MFLATDRTIHRERRVRQFLGGAPSLSLILAAVNFEWTVCRAVLFLSPTANAELRGKMSKFYSLDGYRELWKQEVATFRSIPPLAEVVENWAQVRSAFDARNRLVHGRDRYTRNMATPHVEALLRGVQSIDSYCECIGAPLYARMPIRRKSLRANPALERDARKSGAPPHRER